MKKIFTACFVLSMALFTLGFSGCDGMLSGSDDAEGYFSSSKSKGTGTRGQLTISGIDSGLYGSYRVYVSSSSSESSYASYAVAYSNYQHSISGSTTTVELYTTSSGSSRWNGTGSYYVFFEDSYGLALKSNSSVYFSDGNATISVSNCAVTGRLTITSISSAGLSSGTYTVYVNSNDDETYYDSTGLVASGSVTINSSTSTAIIDLHPNGSSSSSRWNGGGYYYVFVKNNSTNQLVAKSGSIYFSNGSKTVDADSFTGITPGHLTIAGISSGSFYSGTYDVYVNSSSNESSYDTNAEASATSVTINSTTVTLDLFKSDSSPWDGDGGFYVFLEDDSGQLVAKSGQISFSNGSKTIAASDLIPVGLTITGIDSDLDGISMPVSVYVSNNSTNYTDNVSTSVLSITINNSTATLKLVSGNSRWNGSGSYYVFLEFDDSGTQIVIKSSSTVEFVWGTAMVDFNRFELFSPSP